MDSFRAKKGYLCDMDGVIYHGNRLLPGVKEFVSWLYREEKQFLFLTNNSGKTPRELHDKLARMGLEVGGGALLHQRPGHGGVHRQPAPGGHGLRHRGPGAV